MSVRPVFEKLEKNFNPDAAAGLDLVFQFDIEDDSPYHLVIKDGTCELREGKHDDPSVTLIMNTETLQGIVSGETDGMQAFMAGQLRAERRYDARHQAWRTVQHRLITRDRCCPCGACHSLRARASSAALFTGSGTI